jgi:hypothetical protein
MMRGPSTIKDIGIPILAQPGLWAEIFEDGMQLRPGFEEWWNALILSGEVDPYWFIFNHDVGAGLTDDQQLTFDSDCYLISIQGTANLLSPTGTPTYRAQFYEVVDSESGISQMRLGINEDGFVGTAQHQGFLQHPYKMSAGQVLMSRVLNLTNVENKVQIAIFGVKHWTQR